MYKPIRARTARYVCNVLVLFAFFTYALSICFIPLGLYFICTCTHCTPFFVIYTVLLLLSHGYYMLLHVIFLHLYIRACIASYVHNLLVIICFLFTCANSIFPFCLTFHIVL